jgi:hypothetical protein
VQREVGRTADAIEANGALSTSRVPAVAHSAPSSAGSPRASRPTARLGGEEPFRYDLESARALNAELHEPIDESRRVVGGDRMLDEETA